MFIEKKKIMGESMCNEIGSEFWIDSTENFENIETLPKWIYKFGNPVLTSSGRGAISLLLRNCEIKTKTVLMPVYTCNSVILPFIEEGYKCYFYDINLDFTPSLEDFDIYMDIGIFLHMGYFGFPTNNNIKHIVKYFKKKSALVVEDITHTLFSDYNRFEENDYYVASIRKWVGLPSGGFIVGTKRTIENTLKYNESFADKRREALLKKASYINGGCESLKDEYLELFSEGEQILDNDLTPYQLDNLSSVILNNLDVSRLKEKRRANFEVLLKGLKDINNLVPIFNEVSENICPFFYPIYIKKERNEFRRKLIEEEIYCPIHWPVPDIIKSNVLKESNQIYNMILSIPCDQRYEKKHMEKVISVIRGLL
jgi:dTDP-4-amino-4,6-dideoxygalactose transaminase